MADYKLEEGMKNHPGFMPFTHCNASSDAKKQKEEASKAEPDSKK